MPIYELAIEPFVQFGFMRRALIGCVAVSLGAGPVGVFLLLRRLSLTGDALSHAILPGAAIGFIFAGLSLTAMTIGGMIAGLITALGAGAVSRATPLREDASLATFYLVSLALGVAIIATYGGAVDVMHVLFGNVLALDDSALLLLCSIATVSTLIVAAIFRILVLGCVDPLFLRSVTRYSRFTDDVYLVLVVLNVVAAFHAVGTLMAVGVMILPAAIAKFWARSVGDMVVISVACAITASFVGLVFSFHIAVPSGPAIVLALGAVYALSVVFGREGGLAYRLFNRTVRLEA
ncbi:MAG: metal ABC transporter permease [Pseudomonadota bacterium]